MAVLQWAGPPSGLGAWVRAVPHELGDPEGRASPLYAWRDDKAPTSQRQSATPDMSKGCSASPDANGGEPTVRMGETGFSGVWGEPALHGRLKLFANWYWP